MGNKGRQWSGMDPWDQSLNFLQEGLSLDSWTFGSMAAPEDRQHIPQRSGELLSVTSAEAQNLVCAEQQVC